MRWCSNNLVSNTRICLAKLHRVRCMLRVLRERRNAARKVSAFVIACAFANVCDALHVCILHDVVRNVRACEAKTFHLERHFILRCVLHDVTVITVRTSRVMQRTLPAMYISQRVEPRR